MNQEKPLRVSLYQGVSTMDGDTLQGEGGKPSYKVHEEPIERKMSITSTTGERGEVVNQTTKGRKKEEKARARLSHPPDLGRLCFGKQRPSRNSEAEKRKTRDVGERGKVEDFRGKAGGGVARTLKGDFRES